MAPSGELPGARLVRRCVLPLLVPPCLELDSMLDVLAGIAGDSVPGVA